MTLATIPMVPFVVLCDPLCGHVLTHSFHYLSSIFNTTHYREKGHKKFSLFLSLLGHLLLLLQVALTLTVTYRILSGAG